MDWLLFFVCILATWRITHLVQAEDGPFDMIFKLRKMMGNSQVGKMMDCFYCLSIWTAIPSALLLGDTWPVRIVYWLALSGAAIIIEQLVSGHKNQ
ncbi:DUF1360 domain-containing protein [Chitinophaga sp. MM2321]|uniref:DUF1360 domain-containing protein n=1 Tax=Chitinophaga sp. MM2321 TaxID=3137178 RepID=UPI0032D59465